MALFVPDPQQMQKQFDRTLRKFDFQTKYVMPGLAILCFIGIIFFPETGMKWLCVALIVLIGLMTLLLQKVLLPRLRRSIQKFKDKQNAQEI